MALLLIVWAQVSLAVMQLLGEPIAGRPIVRYTSSRLFLFGLAALQLILIWHAKWRTIAVALAAILGLVAAAPVYSPHRVVVAFVHGAHKEASSNVVIVSCVIGLVLAGWLAYGLVERLQAKKSFSKGSTKWGSGQALKRPASGLLLGKLDRQLLRYDRDGHLMTIAATRSGKGVGTVIPNLLEFPGSVLVTDPKGENYAATAGYRSKRLGQQTIALDPFQIVEQTGERPPWSMNPLDLVDLNGPDYVETAMMLADMIVGQPFHAGDSHWDSEAKALLFTYILYVAASNDPCASNLNTVRRLITQAPTDMDKTCRRMKVSKVDQVREGVGRILQKSDRERSAVYSTAQSRTHFLTSPRMQAVLNSTNVHLSSLKKGQLSLYLIIPREYLTVYASWLRLMISCAYTVCTTGVDTTSSRSRLNRRVLFLLDEFANLGYMSNIKEAVSLGAGYGITLWLILQDLAQLRRAYRDEWESFIANCDVIQAFSIQDPFTSEKIARMLGSMTIWERRLAKASRREGSHLKAQYSEASRALINPDELRRLHPNRQVLLVRPYQPVVADKLLYYKDPLFAGRAGLTISHLCVLSNRGKTSDTSA